MESGLACWLASARKLPCPPIWITRIAHRGSAPAKPIHAPNVLVASQAASIRVIATSLDGDAISTTAFAVIRM
jgi:hypothetical protein